MRGKIWGGIMAAMGIIGMVSAITHITETLWMVALFVIFALFTADGIATIVADCQKQDKYETPRFLDEYMEDGEDGR